MLSTIASALALSQNVVVLVARSVTAVKSSRRRARTRGIVPRDRVLAGLEHRPGVLRERLAERPLAVGAGRPLADALEVPHDAHPPALLLPGGQLARELALLLVVQRAGVVGEQP